MRRLRNKGFTLVEMLVSLFLFVGLMALLMEYFSNAQRVWLGSSAKSEMFENARIALDLMENDLLCSYYSYGHSDKLLFFYPKIAKDSGTGRNYYQFGVACMRPAPPNSCTVSSLCEVQYKYDPGKCRLLMNVQGDHCYDGLVNGYWDVGTYASAATASANAFTTYCDDVYDPADPSSDSQDGWSEIIPYVVDFSFALYNKAGARIPSSGYDATTLGSKFIAQADKLPYTVAFSITLVDRDAYARYLAKGGSLADIATTTDKGIVGSKRTFVRRVTIERGQYD